jgi:choline dehydrogenase
VIGWDAWLKKGVPTRTECAGGDKDGLCWVPTSGDPETGARSHSGIGHYVAVINDRPNYHLLSGHKVTRIVYNNGDVEAGPPQVELRPVGSGEPELVEVRREVILSTGAIHTPQILQRSGIGPTELLESAGIDVLVDLPGVGYNLQDHAGPSMAISGTVLTLLILQGHIPAISRTNLLTRLYSVESSNTKPRDALHGPRLPPRVHNSV